MKDLYKKITETLTAQEADTLLQEAELRPIAHVDLFKSQYLNPEAHQLYPTPAVFYEYNVAWVDKGNKTQAGDATVRIHILLEDPCESYDYAPDQDEALKVFDYYELIHILLTGLETCRTTGLQRIAEDPGFSNSTNLIAHIVTYKCMITDDTTDVMNRFTDQEINGFEVGAGKLSKRIRSEEDRESEYII